MGTWTPGPGATADNDVFTGDATSEFAEGLAGNDALSGNDGDDRLFGNEGDDFVDGGSGTDEIHGQSGDDSIAAGEGNDFAWGWSGVDVVHGDGGDDHLFGVAPLVFDFIAREWRRAESEDFAADTLFGGDGNDVLEGGGGADLLDGGDGDDRFVQDFDFTSVDRIVGGAGFDVIDYSASEGEVIVQLSGYATVNHVTHLLLATFSSVEGANGSEYGDALIGDAANNRLTGGGGADWLVGGGGDDWFVQGTQAGVDRLFGDAGIDTIDYSSAGAGVTVQLAGWSSRSGGATLATFTGIENAIGSNFADALIGNAGDNRIVGGGGADWLVGGAGADTFVYRALEAAQDSIRDFTQGQDRVDLSAIDANTLTGADDAFVFATVRHTGVVGEAVVVNFGGSSLVSLYLDGDNIADTNFNVVHPNGIVMGAGDFVL